MGRQPTLCTELRLLARPSGHPCEAYFQVPPDLPNLKRVDLAKAYNSVWIEGLLYKLILLDFPSYLVKTICSYLTFRTYVE